ncbi:nuclear transport factor 2 family protein [Amycolatopsis sp. K13G38]|uniref:Nuclear transport factor 2 family protein n=1 Tax=Amycolatopsis acididurans TaxID=2724524 RepID=A0ABX1J373_9PSEU|nr:nuclear transport factor 2 family protein [Amycolatopsis acididurans]
MEQVVRRLAAIEEIRQLKARYFRAVDLKLWGMFSELFTADLEIDFAESTSKPMTREQFVDSARRHFDGAVSVHHGHVPEIEILDETHARGIWPMFDIVETPQESKYESHTGYGHYTEEYRNEDGRWRISRTQLSRIKRVVLESQ